MAKENISIKFLIHLIGERPALWDKTSDEYKDRSLKETSWREICTFINENYERMMPKAKEEFTRMIMKKWTHIRDSWVKSMKYGYDEKTKRPPKPYIYHNELQFMQKILKCRPRRYDLSMSHLNYDDLYGDKTETQISNGDLSYCENNGEENSVAAAATVVATDNCDENVENVKEEIETNNDSRHFIENQPDNMANGDDWPLDEVDLTPIIELNKMNKKEQNSYKTNVPVKKTRTSIFINSRHDGEEPEPTQQPPPPPPAPAPQHSNLPFNTNKYLYDNRHWNFFKGILPSVNSLDEDHILQFQSGVISLLQKLRESQKRQPKSKSGKMHSLFRGRGRKRKASNDDYEWPMHKMDISNRYSRRLTRNNSDPIAAGDMQTESEYSTDRD